MRKIVLITVAVVLATVLCQIIVFVGIFASIGYTEVVDTVYSPDGTYRAELLNVDQGALGGDTVVKVYNETGILPRRPQIVYMGPWGEFEDMELYWESESVLRINGKAYPIEN